MSKVITVMLMEIRSNEETFSIGILKSAFCLYLITSLKRKLFEILKTH